MSFGFIFMFTLFLGSFVMCCRFLFCFMFTSFDLFFVRYMSYFSSGFGVLCYCIRLFWSFLYVISLLSVLCYFFFCVILILALCYVISCYFIVFFICYCYLFFSLIWLYFIYLVFIYILDCLAS